LVALPVNQSASARARPRIESFSTDRLVLISRASFMRVASWVVLSRAASEPARSIKYSMPSWEAGMAEFSKRRRQMAWERDELSFFSVGAVRRREAAASMYPRRASLVVMWCSKAPAIWVVPKESSRMEI
jgi:hypothetical protein